MADNDNIINRDWMLSFLKGERNDAPVRETPFCKTLSDTIIMNEREPDIVLTKCDPEFLYRGAMDAADLFSRYRFQKDHELIQIGEKNDACYNVIYFLVSAPALNPDEPCLRLVYYESEVAYIADNQTGNWCFRLYGDQDKNSYDSTRVSAFDIAHLWSLFPGDYTLFGSERRFYLKGCSIEGRKALYSSDHQYPLWLMTGNLDTLEFVRTKKELKRVLSKVIKDKDDDQRLFVICGRTCLIPNSPDETKSLLYRAILTLLNQPSAIPRQIYWIPFIKYEYPIANLSGKDTQSEAEYRLKEWMSQHGEDYAKWCSFKEEKPFDWKESTIASDPILYFRRKPNAFVQLEEKFPFIKDGVTDIPMHIEGWTSDGENVEKRNRQPRKQAIKTLMFAALGINREQYKYLRRQHI